MCYINGKKIKILDSKEYGLSTRTIVGETLGKLVVLIKDRKSRIIMKDGRKILEQIDSVKKHVVGAQVGLATNAPICSKTTKYFKENKIEVFRLEK